jgi:predicted GNAT superfamily acetyltransferase
VEAAAAGNRRLVSGDSIPWRLRPGAGMRPRCDVGMATSRFKVRVPPDIEALRRSDPALAHEWRTAVRDVLGSSLEQGGSLVGIDGQGDFVVEEATE